MQSIDLNLLIALDALLTEGSIIGAAQRMNLSPPAMSRTLGRIRHALSDEILVRAGRKMVPTPRALELQCRVHGLLEEVRTVLRPDAGTDLSTIERAFTVRASDYVIGVFGVPLQVIVAQEAPHITLRFVDEGKEDVSHCARGILTLISACSVISDLKSACRHCCVSALSPSSGMVIRC
jgi:DNA-binding transcriptional LysR family regulator